MSIVTRRGDKGETSLFPQGLVSKDDVYIELVGTLDELTSFLGVVRSRTRDRRVKGEVAVIQKELFWVSAEAVTLPAYLKRLKRRIGEQDVKRLEKAIHAMEKRGGRRARCFRTPGVSSISALLHVCRALCRRAERRMTTLKKKKRLRNDAMFVYINRLSDLLFLMAEASLKKH